ncbi:MAG: ABC transporter permease subunit [Planctomycetes bacterium]|nr:ABC transporter permease subunit [Planctomycetota bacterium]
MPERLRGVLPLLAVLVLALLALALGEYDLAPLLDPQEFARAIGRAATFLSAFGAPELGSGFLATCVRLTLDTFAMAMAATGIAIVLGLALALCTSHNVVLGESRGARRLVLQALCESARVVQDILRGVPDFAWAVILIASLSLGPPAGVAALALNVSGILARVYSELFDAVPARLLEPLRASGATRLQTFCYGVVPACGSTLVSFTLLRWECAVRNAAVIGAVNAGGLGSEIKRSLDYGEYSKVLTLLACLLLLTVGSDLVSAFVRGRLAQDPDHPLARRGGERSPGAQRASVFLLILVLVALWAWAMLHCHAAWWGNQSLEDRWQSTVQLFGGLLAPDLSLLPRAFESAVVPLSMAFLGTLLAALGAAVLAYPASATFQLLDAGFTGERISGARRAVRAVLLAAARGVAIVSRSVPDVFWALLLVSFFRLGTMPGMVALAIHSLGLLIRLFAEGADAVPLRRLEVVHAASGSRAKTYLYGAIPPCASHWVANTFFQFESNVRSGIVLGIVGVQGLGFLFTATFEWFRMDQAGTYLLVMVLLSLGLDRLSRVLGLARARIQA